MSHVRLAVRPGLADTAVEGDGDVLPTPADVRSSESRKLVSSCDAALKAAAKRDRLHERLSAELTAVRDLVVAREARVAKRSPSCAQR